MALQVVQHVAQFWSWNRFVYIVLCISDLLLRNMAVQPAAAAVLRSLVHSDWLQQLHPKVGPPAGLWLCYLLHMLGGSMSQGDMLSLWNAYPLAHISRDIGRVSCACTYAPAPT